MIPGLPGGVTAGQTENDYCPDTDSYVSITYYPWIYYASDGTQHSFEVSTTEPQSDCPTTDVPNASGYAADGSGYYISITGYASAIVYGPDGTRLDQIKRKDPNGNTFSYTGVISPPEWKYLDTLGRTIVDVTKSSDGLTYYYAIPNAQGGTSTYTIKLGSVNVNSNFSFDPPFYYEYSGSFTTITEVDLPDTTKYQFSYDSGTSSGHYGMLTQMTLPSGGPVNYTFDKFVDGIWKMGMWITHRTTPDSSTAWSYSGPNLPSGCHTVGNYYSCQTVTVTKPSGDYIIYTYNFGGPAVDTYASPWPVLGQYYNPSSTLLATTSICYGSFTVSSGSCSYSGFPFPYFVHKTGEITTLPVPGGNVSTTKTYSWDWSATLGNMTQTSEWNFGSSLSGAADRTTSITYYSNGNVVNHPATTTVTDSSGATVAKTVNSYDGSSLVTSGATGVAQHDDTNYGSGFTARGNLTQNQRLISGTYK
jgi:hypothetical protein